MFFVNCRIHLSDRLITLHSTMSVTQNERWKKWGMKHLYSVMIHEGQKKPPLIWKTKCVFGHVRELVQIRQFSCVGPIASQNGQLKKLGIESICILSGKDRNVG